MNKAIENLIINSKKAYKECSALNNTKLEDILLDILTDAKKLEEMINNNFEDNIKDSIISKKKRYTYEQVIAISKLQLHLAKEEISLAKASSEILEIADHFPIHNLVQYNKRFKKALMGVGEYGFAFPSNWAKALLEITNNDSMVIKALKEQQRLYREKDGRVNQTLEDLLDGLEKNMKGLEEQDNTMNINEPKYLFQSKEYKKGQHNNNSFRYLVLDVIKKYLNENNKTYKDLQDKFNFLHSSKVIFNEEDYINWQLDGNENDTKRYFEEPIIYNEKKYYILTQWGHDKIHDRLGEFISFAKNELNYDIQKIQ